MHSVGASAAEWVITRYYSASRMTNPMHLLLAVMRRG
jgi:hypothetical protein